LISLSPLTRGRPSALPRTRVRPFSRRGGGCGLPRVSSLGFGCRPTNSGSGYLRVSARWTAEVVNPLCKRYAGPPLLVTPGLEVLFQSFSSRFFSSFPSRYSSLSLGRGRFQLRRRSSFVRTEKLVLRSTRWFHLRGRTRAGAFTPRGRPFQVRFASAHVGKVYAGDRSPLRAGSRLIRVDSG